MNIYITGLGSGYEVEHLVRLFYPMAPLTLIPPEDGADCVWAEKRPDKLWAMVRQGGKSQTAEAPLPIPVEEGGETPEFALASLTYDLLRSWTGVRPPWGKMTGVRPVRLVHDKRAAGWTEEEIDDFFLKRFDCSPEIRHGQGYRGLAGAYPESRQCAQDLQPLYRHPVLPLPVQLLQLRQLQPRP